LSQVLSTKKVLYLVNMTPRDYLRSNSAQHPAVLAVQQSVELQSGESGKDAEVFPISTAFEESLRRIELQEGPEALKSYFEANPTHVSAVGTILAEVHRALGIIHFYTVDDRLVRCWCVKQGKNIQESAAVVDVNISRCVGGDTAYALVRSVDAACLRALERVWLFATALPPSSLWSAGH
jgi:ribosome-binding ATPase YchF (GTP1/OBG family)